MKSWKKLGALAALGLSTLASAQEINLSGFASAHMTQKLGGNSAPEYYSNRTNFYNFTKFGLNVASKIDEQWSVQSQLLVSGKRLEAGAEDPQFNMYANWLFLAYRPTDNFRLKIGRQLFPAWLVSEYIDVGYMYPWTETPHSVYELSPFKSLNGLAADYTFPLNSTHKMSVTVFGGQENVDIPLAQGGTEVNKYGNIIGSELAIQTSSYRFRVMGSNYKVNSEADDCPATGCQNSSVTTLTTGFKYEKNGLLVFTEYGYREGSKNGSEVTDTPYAGVTSRAFNKRAQAGYLTVGYWFNKTLPHLTASTSKYETGLIEGTQDLYSLGVNHKVNDNIIFKTNVGYSVSRQGPAHMEVQGDATTASAGLDMIF
jgi:hypothetical protein